MRDSANQVDSGMKMQIFKKMEDSMESLKVMFGNRLNHRKEIRREKKRIAKDNTVRDASERMM